MAYIMVDVESDGPIPGDYSMISFGAVLVNENLDTTFYGRLKPISDNYLLEVLAVSGYTRNDTLSFDDPKKIMEDFKEWLIAISSVKLVFISDNNGYDWMFICWYLVHFTGSNPFGHSSQNLGSIYKGIVKNTSLNFKHLRKTKHTHHPVDDAKGNAEALLDIINNYGLQISL